MHAHMSACWVQVMAVPASRQGSGVSMHELRLPSSSSVTAHRWSHTPTLSPMAPSAWSALLLSAVHVLPVSSKIGLASLLACEGYTNHTNPLPTSRGELTPLLSVCSRSEKMSCQTTKSNRFWVRRSPLVNFPSKAHQHHVQVVIWGIAIEEALP